LWLHGKAASRSVPAAADRTYKTEHRLSRLHRTAASTERRCSSRSTGGIGRNLPDLLPGFGPAPCCLPGCRSRLRPERSLSITHTMIMQALSTKCCSACCAAGSSTGAGQLGVLCTCMTLCGSAIGDRGHPNWRSQLHEETFGCRRTALLLGAVIADGAGVTAERLWLMLAQLRWRRILRCALLPSLASCSRHRGGASLNQCH